MQTQKTQASHWETTAHMEAKPDHSWRADIARMEAELQAYKDFIQFMAEESAKMQAALINQAQEQEPTRN